MVLKEHNKNFLNQFKDIIFGDHNASETLRKLTNEPKRNVITWQGYSINKYLFYTKSQDDKSTMQNSGVSLMDESQHFATRVLVLTHFLKPLHFLFIKNNSSGQ